MTQSRMLGACKSVLYICRNGRRFYAQSTDFVEDNRLRALFSRLALLHEDLLVRLNPMDPPGRDERALVCLEAAMAGEVYRDVSANLTLLAFVGYAASVLAGAERHTASVLRLALHQELPDNLKDLFQQRSRSFDEAARQLDKLAT